jgi:hypothetical protein
MSLSDGYGIFVKIRSGAWFFLSFWYKDEYQALTQTLT